MSDDVAVYWLEPPGAEAQSDREGRQQAARDLADWALARGVRLTPIEPHGPAIAIDPSIAETAEKELDRAHEAIGASDADAAERALSRAETLLRAHPELPQAPWLRAEVERTWSVRWSRLVPRDEARARMAWENAQALDGGRVAGIGETSFPARPPVKANILLKGEGAPRLTLWLDGMPIEPRSTDAAGAQYEVEVAPGEHHVQIGARGRANGGLEDRIMFASWVAVGAGADATRTAPIVIRLGTSGVCSQDSFGDVKRDGEHVDATGVTCPRWIAVAGAAPGARRRARDAACSWRAANGTRVGPCSNGGSSATTRHDRRNRP